MEGMELIRRALPHRYPFLMIDRIAEVEKNKRIVALKNVTAGEPHFVGHFPQYPVMPGVLIVEALAQAAGVLMFVSSGLDELPQDRYSMLAGVDSCRFRRMVVPGDQLLLHVELTRQMRQMARFAARAEVGGETACEAVLTSFHTEVNA